MAQARNPRNRGKSIAAATSMLATALRKVNAHKSAQWEELQATRRNFWIAGTFGVAQVSAMR
jgi:hypothetical protein